MFFVYSCIAGGKMSEKSEKNYPKSFNTVHQNQKIDYICKNFIMITEPEISALLHSTETYRVEKTISTGNMDKFCEAICAFANDLPDSRKKGYLFIGANDDGSLSGLKVGDALMKKIAAIRSDGNILPLPVMNVERLEFKDGDLLVVEVSPSLIPPVRYRGRVFVRIGPRRDIASEEEERRLTERRTAYMATFDATPCLGATLDDIDLKSVQNDYLPSVVDAEILANDHRDIKEQLASIRLYDRRHDCPTYAGIILFGKNPRYFLPGAYVQYVRFAGNEKGGAVLNEKRFQGSLYSLIPTLELFVNNAIMVQRPVAVSLFKEKTVINYPEKALRELIMNACMHRDYQSNMPIRLYQFDNYIEIMNAGGLYGEARPENFPLVNDYRNPVVAEAMKEMKYVNMFNQGISRVQNMLKDNDNQPALFDVSQITVFRVVVNSTFEEIGVPQNDTEGEYQNDTQGDTQGQNVPQGVPQGGTQDKNVTQDGTQNVTQGGTQDGTQGEYQNDTQGDTQDKNGTQGGTQDKNVPQGGTQGGTQGKNVTQDGTQGGTQDEDLCKWIEEQIINNPKITTEELAQKSEKGVRTIKRYLAKMPHIKYIGSGYSGHWEITKT